MNCNELLEKLNAEVERAVCFIQHDLVPISNDRFRYSPHVRRCNIIQILHHLATVNARYIAEIENALPALRPTADPQPYKPGFAATYALKSIRMQECHSKKTPVPESLDAAKVLETILDQQVKTRALMAQSIGKDLNQRTIPYLLFGSIRLSLAAWLQLMVQYQKQQLSQARKIVMVMP
jgi:hypothetical protein